MTRKFVIAALPIALLVLFFVIRSQKTPKIEIQLTGDSFFEGLKIVSRNNGVTDWILKAKRADLSKDGKFALLKDVDLTLERQGVSVNAERGLYNMETRQITVDGTLKAENKGFHITTSQVVVNGREGKIVTPEGVRVEGRNFALEGKGLQADNNKHKVRILKNVKATFNR